MRLRADLRSLRPNRSASSPVRPAECVPGVRVPFGRSLGQAERVPSKSGGTPQRHLEVSLFLAGQELTCRTVPAEGVLVPTCGAESYRFMQSRTHELGRKHNQELVPDSVRSAIIRNIAKVSVWAWDFQVAEESQRTYKWKYENACTTQKQEGIYTSQAMLV